MQKHWIAPQQHMIIFHLCIPRGNGWFLCLSSRPWLSRANLPFGILNYFKMNIQQLLAWYVSSSLSCLFVENEIQHPRYLWKQETKSSDFGCYLHSVVSNYFDNRWMLLNDSLHVCLLLRDYLNGKPNPTFDSVSRIQIKLFLGITQWSLRVRPWKYTIPKGKGLSSSPIIFWGGELSNFGGVFV